MCIEVEIKAWVDDFDKTLKLLKDNYNFVKQYHKEDIYLEGIDSFSEARKEVRLRKDGDSYIVTYKDRSHEDKVEVNIEKEFNIDHKDNFLYVMNQLGFKEYIRKEKKGYLFNSNNINLELSHVNGLGDFIEIEKIITNRCLIDSTKEDLYNILKVIDINKSKIEDRYYVQMLKEGK